MTVAELKKLLDDYADDTAVELCVYRDVFNDPYAILVAMPYGCPDQTIFEEGQISHD